MDLVWGIYGLPTPEKEFHFHKTRHWRFDHCWPSKKIAVEIDGGAWIRGRHNRAAGFQADAEKFNEATKAGWRVYHFSPQQLRSGEAQEFMKEILLDSPGGKTE